jgi:hypothetical protein
MVSRADVERGGRRLALVTALLCACTPAARTPTATTPPPACSSQASAAAPTPTTPTPTIDARSYLSSALQAEGAVYWPVLDDAGVSCRRVTFTPDATSGTPTHGVLSVGYRYAITAGALHLQLDLAQLAPSEKDRSWELLGRCDESLPLSGWGPGYVLVAGSKWFFSARACEAEKGATRPVHARCEEARASRRRPGYSTTKWKPLRDAIEGRSTLYRRSDAKTCAPLRLRRIQTPDAPVLGAIDPIRGAIAFDSGEAQLDLYQSYDQIWLEPLAPQTATLPPGSRGLRRVALGAGSLSIGDDTWYLSKSDCDGAP